MKLPLFPENPKSILKYVSSNVLPSRFQFYLGKLTSNFSTLCNVNFEHVFCAFYSEENETHNNITPYGENLY